jgi:hypothetical protein
MAKAFERWTVLSHKPIEKLEPNLWRVEGTMPDGKTQRSMVVARKRNGGLVIHNAIALGADEMKELEAFGEPELLVVPNGFHRQDARIYKERYPGLRVICPAGSRKRVEQVVHVDASLEDERGDDDVTLERVDGAKQEGVLTVRSGDKVSLVFCDLVLNLPPSKGLMGFALAPTGRLSVPRVVRWIGMTNRDAIADRLSRLADLPGLTRVLVGHGRTQSDSPAEALKAAARELAG